MTYKEHRKRENLKHLNLICNISDPTILIIYFESMTVDMQLFGMLKKAGKLDLLEYYDGKLPIKAQKILASHEIYIKYDESIEKIFDICTQGHHSNITFNRLYSLEMRYSVLKKKPRYIENMPDDRRAEQIIAVYHPEFYVSHWNFGYGMDLLAIKVNSKKKDRIFKKLINKRQIVHISIQFAYFRPHKHQFNNEDYDLIFKYE